MPQKNKNDGQKKNVSETSILIDYNKYECIC